MASINEFKSKLKGGVRPNLYEVEIPFPNSKASLTTQTKFLCRSAALPGSTQGLIEVPFRGRFLKIPGDRTFEAWTATFYNTEEFDLRGAFEGWINLGNKVDENIGTYAFGGSDGFNQYFQDIVIRQKTKNANFKEAGSAAGSGDPNAVLRSYKLIGAWPTSVSPITVAYDNNDAIEEFDVEFQYQYFDTFGSGSNDAERSNKEGILTGQDVSSLDSF